MPKDTRTMLSEEELTGVGLVPSASSIGLRAQSVLADLMELFGADPYYIEKRTGFTKDMSGKWAKLIKAKNFAEYVGDVPVIERDKVVQSNGIEVSGLYNPKENGPTSIEISRKSPDMSNTLNHEVAHHLELAGLDRKDVQKRMGFIGDTKEGQALATVAGIKAEEAYTPHRVKPTEIQAHLLEFFTEDHINDGRTVMEALQSKPQNTDEARQMAEIIIKRNMMPLKAWKEIYPNKTPVELLNHLAKFQADRFAKSDVKTKRLITGD